MSAAEFPIPVGRVLATVARVLSLQAKPDLANILTSAEGQIDAVGSDFGVEYYTLTLRVPVSLFAASEPQLSAIETAILGKLQTVIRNDAHVISKVAVSPVLEEPMSRVGRPDVGDDRALRLWGPQTCRLFLSHVAVHKVAVSDLKRSLRTLGISGFVAHEDIEPTLEWQAEIDVALRSMHAMVALLTPEFHESKWTDQETGAALARGVIVVPVKLGLDPYGFLGKHQALPGDLAKPDELAAAIVGVLEKQPTTGNLVREGLVLGLESASSFANAKLVVSSIEKAGGFLEGQLRRMEASIATNSQVGGSTRVPERLRRYVSAHSVFGSA